MAETVQIISDPAWWITVVMVGLFINLFSGFLQNIFLDRRKRFEDSKAHIAVTEVISTHFNKLEGQLSLLMTTILGISGTFIAILAMVRPSRNGMNLIICVLGLFLILAGLKYFWDYQKAKTERETPIYPEIN